MKVDVHWIVDGVMSVDASSPEEGEKAVSDLLTTFIQSHPELTSHFGAKAIQGQALDGEGQPLAAKPVLDS
ncbi:MAG: translation initiation factor IF-2 [Candidatus Puniceispirillaceae bacterium]